MHTKPLSRHPKGPGGVGGVGCALRLRERHPSQAISVSQGHPVPSARLKAHIHNLLHPSPSLGGLWQLRSLFLFLQMRKRRFRGAPLESSGFPIDLVHCHTLPSLLQPAPRPARAPTHTYCCVCLECPCHVSWQDQLLLNCLRTQQVPKSHVRPCSCPSEHLTFGKR